MKRMIVGNTVPNGKLDTDAFQRAMLTYRNSPDPETRISPAMCIFGSPTRSTISILPGKYRPHPTWRDTLQRREEALRTRHFKIAERLSLGTRHIPPLRIGDHVRIQNQMGSNPRKWDKTGLVVEVRQHDQYAIKVDGSGRITLRNRKFLRKFIPVMPRTTGNFLPNTSSFQKVTPTSQYMENRMFPAPETSTSHVSIPDLSSSSVYLPPSTIMETPPQGTHITNPASSLDAPPAETLHTPAHSPPCHPPQDTTTQKTIPLRKSSRPRKTPAYLTDYEH